jgi:large subunit ribosomal protein L15
MKLHALINTPGARKRRLRVGRGMASGKGKTSGRGHKGQYARSGHKHKPGFEGGQMRLVRRLPKRGFKNPRATAYLPVNVGDLDVFAEGSEVTWDRLKDAGLARGGGSGVKLLGSGEVRKKLTVKLQAFSAGAKAKIEAAGGVCEVVP